MSLDVQTAARQLSARSLADPTGMLKPAGRREVEEVIKRWEAQGRFAHVLCVPASDLGPFHAVWGKLSLTETRDLLLLFDGMRWEARGWGLSPQVVERELETARPALKQYYGKGLAVALEGLGKAAGPLPSP